MSSLIERNPQRDAAITQHDALVRASVNTGKAQMATVGDQAASIKTAIASMRGDQALTGKFKSQLDQIDAAADQILASKNTFDQTLSDVSLSSQTLVKMVPSTDEHPYVSPGQADGTATHPQTDAVIEDPRNSQRRGNMAPVVAATPAIPVAAPPVIPTTPAAKPVTPTDNPASTPAEPVRK